MASQTLINAVNDYDNYIMRYPIIGRRNHPDLKKDAIQVIEAYLAATNAAFLDEEDYVYGKTISQKGIRIVEEYIRNFSQCSWEEAEQYCQDVKEIYDEVQYKYEFLKLEAPQYLDSYCLYIEKNRLRKDRFYEPRKKTLKRVVDKLQMLEDDELDELFVHQPPRTGKTGIMTDFSAWHCAKDMEKSNLYATYKESLGGAFLVGVQEIWTDPTYAHMDVFPETRIVATDAKNHKIDLGRKKKYASLSGKGLESGLNGEYDATGILIIDDILEGIQDVLNPEILRRKQIVFDNNLMSRKKEKCKVIYNGTIWSLQDIFSDRVNFLESNPEAKDIRWDILKLPALNENDESNFDYDFGVGFSTKYFLTKRAKFEDNDDIASWMAQYQQEPIEREGAVFKPDNMKFYNGVLPNEEPLRVCAACDVALGGGDFLSMPVAYIYENGDIYVHDVVFDNSEKKITKPQVVEKLLNNNCGSAFFEANQGGEGYKDEVETMLREKGKKLNITSKYAPSDRRKEQRIWDKAGSIREMYFRDSSCRDSQYKKFMLNLYSFTMTGNHKKKHDDAPDSLATLAAFIEGSWSPAKVEAVKNPFAHRGLFD